MISSILWILLCSWMVCTGWVLSALHQLNADGYVLSLLLFGCISIWWLSNCSGHKQWISRGLFSRLWRRFREPLPLIYLVYLLAAFIGGIIHAPGNYDALCYRLPRILHWCSEGQWHWIGAFNIRMDYSATGFEWLMAPLLIIFKTDRLFFLINVISYSLLPGLIYSVLVGLGIRRRVAWYWMWLLPTAYCFVLQAGSIGNDMFATVYFLASAGFALRAARMSSWSDAAISILSAALMTGAKASNLPLLLPLAFLMAGMVRVLVRRPWKSLVLAVVACGVCFLPMAAMNLSHTGDWTGDPSNSEKMKLSNPLAGLAGNFMQLSLDAVIPPVFPTAKSWNAASERLFGKKSFRSLRDQYPRIGLSVGELATEEGAGLGLGLFILCCIGLVFSIGYRFCGGFSRPAMIFGLLSCVALAAFMAKLGSESAARLAAPYYAGIVIPLLALRSQVLLVAKGWWKLLALACALSVLPAVLLNPARPLIPVPILISMANGLHAPESVITRIRMVYSVYAGRSDSLAQLRDHLPADSKRIGFAGAGNEPEYSLWKPFWERIVLDVGSKERIDPNDFDADCIVASEEGIRARFDLPVETYARSMGGVIVYKARIPIFAGKEPSQWLVIVPQEGKHF